jgi:ATP-dependent protease HslVU (ClpYQ) peptidase subunit
MTCIVAVKDKNKIWMGGDSAACDEVGNSIIVRKHPKVFQNGKFLIGFSGSFRVGQILQYHFVPPKNKSNSDYEYMCTSFVEEIQHTFSICGFTDYNKVSTEIPDSELIVAYKKEIYTIHQDYDVSQNVVPYAATGTGYDLAMGTLYAIHNLNVEMHPEEKVEMALNAASTFTANVLPPYTILAI